MRISDWSSDVCSSDLGYHNLSLMAAGVAFYAFLSFVPLLGAVVMTYGLVADPATVAQHMQAIIELVPSDAAALIQDQLVNVAATAASKAGLGLAIADRKSTRLNSSH